MRDSLLPAWTGGSRVHHEDEGYFGEGSQRDVDSVRSSSVLRYNSSGGDPRAPHWAPPHWGDSAMKKGSSNGGGDLRDAALRAPPYGGQAAVETGSTRGGVSAREGMLWVPLYAEDSLPGDSEGATEVPCCDGVPSAGATCEGLTWNPLCAPGVAPARSTSYTEADKGESRLRRWSRPTQSVPSWRRQGGPPGDMKQLLRTRLAENSQGPGQMFRTRLEEVPQGEGLLSWKRDAISWGKDVPVKERDGEAPLPTDSAIKVTHPLLGDLTDAGPEDTLTTDSAADTRSGAQVQRTTISLGSSTVASIADKQHGPQLHLTTAPSQQSSIADSPVDALQGPLVQQDSQQDSPSASSVSILQRSLVHSAATSQQSSSTGFSMTVLQRSWVPHAATSQQHSPTGSSVNAVQQAMLQHAVSGPYNEQKGSPGASLRRPLVHLTTDSPHNRRIGSPGGSKQRSPVHLRDTNPYHGSTISPETSNERPLVHLTATSPYESPSDWSDNSLQRPRVHRVLSQGRYGSGRGMVRSWSFELGAPKDVGDGRSLLVVRYGPFSDSWEVDYPVLRKRKNKLNLLAARLQMILDEWNIAHGTAPNDVGSRNPGPGIVARDQPLGARHGMLVRSHSGALMVDHCDSVPQHAELDLQHEVATRQHLDTTDPPESYTLTEDARAGLVDGTGQGDGSAGVGMSLAGTQKGTEGPESVDFQEPVPDCTIAQIFQPVQGGSCSADGGDGVVFQETIEWGAAAVGSTLMREMGIEPAAEVEVAAAEPGAGKVVAGLEGEQGKQAVGMPGPGGIANSSIESRDTGSSTNGSTRNSHDTSNISRNMSSPSNCNPSSAITTAERPRAILSVRQRRSLKGREAKAADGQTQTTTDPPAAPTEGKWQETKETQGKALDTPELPWGQHDAKDAEGHTQEDYEKPLSEQRGGLEAARDPQDKVERPLPPQEDMLPGLLRVCSQAQELLEARAGTYGQSSVERWKSRQRSTSLTGESAKARALRFWQELEKSRAAQDARQNEMQREDQQDQGAADCRTQGTASGSNGKKTGEEPGEVEALSPAPANPEVEKGLALASAGASVLPTRTLTTGPREEEGDEAKKGMAGVATFAGGGGKKAGSKASSGANGKGLDFDRCPSDGAVLKAKPHDSRLTKMCEAEQVAAHLRTKYGMQLPKMRSFSERGLAEAGLSLLPQGFTLSQDLKQDPELEKPRIAVSRLASLSGRLTLTKMSGKELAALAAKEASNAQTEAPPAQTEGPHANTEASSALTETPHVRTVAPNAQKEDPHANNEDPTDDMEGPHVQEEAPRIQNEAPHFQKEAPHVQAEAPHDPDEVPRVHKEASQNQEKLPHGQDEAPHIHSADCLGTGLRAKLFLKDPVALHLSGNQELSYLNLGQRPKTADAGELGAGENHSMGMKQELPYLCLGMPKTLEGGEDMENQEMPYLCLARPWTTGAGKNVEKPGLSYLSLKRLMAARAATGKQKQALPYLCLGSFMTAEAGGGTKAIEFPDLCLARPKTSDEDDGVANQLLPYGCLSRPKTAEEDDAMGKQQLLPYLCLGRPETSPEDVGMGNQLLPCGCLAMPKTADDDSGMGKQALPYLCLGRPRSAGTGNSMERRLLPYACLGMPQTKEGDEGGLVTAGTVPDPTPKENHAPLDLLQSEEESVLPVRPSTAGPSGFGQGLRQRRKGLKVAPWAKEGLKEAKQATEVTKAIAGTVVSLKEGLKEARARAAGAVQGTVACVDQGLKEAKAWASGALKGPPARVKQLWVGSQTDWNAKAVSLRSHILCSRTEVTEEALGKNEEAGQCNPVDSALETVAANGGDFTELPIHKGTAIGGSDPSPNKDSIQSGSCLALPSTAHGMQLRALDNSSEDTQLEEAADVTVAESQCSTSGTQTALVTDEAKTEAETQNSLSMKEKVPGADCLEKEDPMKPESQAVVKVHLESISEVDIVEAVLGGKLICRLGKGTPSFDRPKETSAYDQHVARIVGAVTEFYISCYQA